jgi:hypothetical protein
MPMIEATLSPNALTVATKAVLVNRLLEIDDGHRGAFGELVTMPDVMAYGAGGRADSIGAPIHQAMTPILGPGPTV